MQHVTIEVNTKSFNHFLISSKPLFPTWMVVAFGSSVQVLSLLLVAWIVQVKVRVWFRIVLT